MNWVFWLWVDQDRLSYVMSWGTLVDALTLLPEVVLFVLAEAESVAGTADTLPTLNLLRVLRCGQVLMVFRHARVCCTDICLISSYIMYRCDKDSSQGQLDDERRYLSTGGTNLLRSLLMLVVKDCSGKR